MYRYAGWQKINIEKNFQKSCKFCPEIQVLFILPSQNKTSFIVVCLAMIVKYLEKIGFSWQDEQESQHRVHICGPKLAILKKDQINILWSRAHKWRLFQLTKKDGWLPPAYFPASHFGKDAFLKDESVFFSKYCVSSSYFLILPNWKNFLIFSQKTSQLRWKDFIKK